jgi:hypothetical protein
MASAAWRAVHSTHLDIPYAAKERTKWDLYPGADADAPCLVHIHGGYWQRNSRKVFACLAEGVARHGWSAALPGYTLAPDASLAGIVGELRIALDWLHSHRAAYRIAGPIVLSGWSAGGHLTALLLDHPCVAAGLSISGIYELGPIRDTYLNEKLRLRDEEIVTLSPLRLAQSAKPLEIVYGSRELPALVASSRTLHTCLHPATIISRSWKHCAIPSACSRVVHSVCSMRVTLTTTRGKPSLTAAAWFDLSRQSLARMRATRVALPSQPRIGGALPVPSPKNSRRNLCTRLPAPRSRDRLKRQSVARAITRLTAATVVGLIRVIVALPIRGRDGGLLLLTYLNFPPRASGLRWYGSYFASDDWLGRRTIGRP